MRLESSYGHNSCGHGGARHLFPDSEEVGRGAMDAILGQALAEQERSEEAK
jgi:hypothetical protein